MPESEPSRAGADAPAPHPDAPLAAWYLRSRHRQLWTLPLTAALVIITALLLLRGTLEDPRANLLKSRAALLALTLPPVPKGENAADDYALARWAKAPWPVSGVTAPPEPFVDGDSRLFEDPAVQNYVTANSTAIQHLWTGAAKARCDWGTDYGMGQAMNTSYVLPLREYAELLAVHARVAAHAGNHQAAARSIAAIHGMAQHCAVDAFWFPIVITGAVDSFGDQALQAIVIWDPPANADDIAAYRKAMPRTRHARERTLRSLAMARAVELHSLDSICSGAIAPRMVGGPMRNLLPDRGGRLLYGPERRCYDAVMEELITRVAGGELVGNNGFSALVRKHQTGSAIFAGEVLQSCWQVQIVLLHGEEQGRVMDAGLAFLQFRVKHGRDAQSLDELVPEFLAAPPKGVFHDTPLRLTLDPKGVRTSDSNGKETRLAPGATRVYALGPNNVDDGGHSGYYGPLNEGETSPGQDDTVIVIPPRPDRSVGPAGRRDSQSRPAPGAASEKKP